VAPTPGIQIFLPATPSFPSNGTILTVEIRSERQRGPPVDILIATTFATSYCMQILRQSAKKLLEKSSLQERDEANCHMKLIITALVTVTRTGDFNIHVI
jgi:hypothetical protein